MSFIVYLEKEPKVSAVLADEVQELFEDDLSGNRPISIDDVGHIANEFPNDILIGDLRNVIKVAKNIQSTIYIF